MILMLLILPCEKNTRPSQRILDPRLRARDLTYAIHNNLNKIILMMFAWFIYAYNSLADGNIIFYIWHSSRAFSSLLYRDSLSTFLKKRRIHTIYKVGKYCIGKRKYHCLVCSGNGFENSCSLKTSQNDAKYYTFLASFPLPTLKFFKNTFLFIINSQL
jgi:hypothetical protein